MGAKKDTYQFKWGSGGIVPDVNIRIRFPDNGEKATVILNAFSEPMFLESADLQRFALNILRAIGSKYAPKLGGTDIDNYYRVHSWLKKEFGKAKRCENPDCTTPEHPNFEWALIKGKEYKKDFDNFIQLCQPCHRKYDQTPESCANKAIGARNRNNRTVKRVRQLTIKGELIKVHKSVAAAAFEHNRTSGAISMAASGQIKTCAGFKWEYETQKLKP